MFMSRFFVERTVRPLPPAATACSRGPGRPSTSSFDVHSDRVRFTPPVHPAIVGQPHIGTTAMIQGNHIRNLRGGEETRRAGKEARQDGVCAGQPVKPPAIVGQPPPLSGNIGTPAIVRSNFIGTPAIVGQHIGTPASVGQHSGTPAIVGQHIGTPAIVGQHIGTNVTVDVLPNGGVGRKH